MVLLVAGLALTGLLLGQAVAAAPEAPVEIGTSGTVRVDRAALTVFSSRPDTAPDSCVVTGPGGRAVDLAPRAGERVGSWYAFARAAVPAPAGDYAVSCADSGDGTSYAVGRYGSVLDFVLALFAVVAAAGVTLALAGSIASRAPATGSRTSSGRASDSP